MQLSNLPPLNLEYYQVVALVGGCGGGLGRGGLRLPDPAPVKFKPPDRTRPDPTRIDRIHFKHLLA